MGPAPQPKDDALRFLFVEIGEIWEGTFGKHLAMTARGPTVRFFKACLNPLLDTPLTDEAIRDRVRVLLRMGK